ncbi:MAG: hypothetical protein ABL888_09365 [Pirellulaceae bacterium]|jgi:hypothetical protein
MTKKKSEGNVSEAIRSCFDQNREAKPKAIAEILNKKGVAVSPQYVSVILSQYRKRLGVKRKKRGTRIDGSSNSAGLQLSDLKLVKQLVDKTGSAERVRDAINAYIELTK